MTGHADSRVRLSALLICMVGIASLLPGCTVPEAPVPTLSSIPVNPYLPYAVVADDGDGGALRLHLAPLVEDGQLVSGFGWRRHPMGGGGAYHRGLDIAAPSGTPVRAAASGEVVEAGWQGDYGLMVRIRHSDEVETVYAHLSRLTPQLELGRQVRQDEVIGHVGSTGRATGPHLHFEVRHDGRALDPLALPPVPSGG